MNKEIRREWALARDELVAAVVELGFPAELGEACARQLKSPKAMHRLVSYLYRIEPDRPELVVDEMLAICSEIDAWREKKASEEANAAYNMIINEGLHPDDES